MTKRLPAFVTVPAALLLLLAAPIAAIAFASARGEVTALHTADAARGRYLVEQVGLCADCHTSRNDLARVVAERWSMGESMPLHATVSMPWADVAPDDVRDVVAYLRQLATSGSTVAKGSR